MKLNLKNILLFQFKHFYLHKYYFIKEYLLDLAISIVGVVMEYIKGKVVSIKDNKIIFDVNNIGYEIEGISSTKATTLYLKIIPNIKLNTKTIYGFEDKDKRDLFTELNNVKGFGPKSALTLILNNKVEEIRQAQQSGNLIKLNSQGIKPSYLVLIIPKKNKDCHTNIMLLKSTLIKYGFIAKQIDEAIKIVYKDYKTLDKNIVEVIKFINEQK